MNKEKSGNGGNKMTRRGKIIAREMYNYCGKKNILLHPIAYFAQCVIPLTEKTIRSRLNNDDWMHKELIVLQQTLKSEELQKDIDDEYKEAFKY